MKRRLLLFFLIGIALLNLSYRYNPVHTGSVLSGDYIWDGGSPTDPEDWMDPLNWDGDNLPPSNGDVIIDGSFTVRLSTDETVESVAILGGASLIIESGATLNTNGGVGTMMIASDAIYIEGASGNESSLIVNGTLNIVGEETGSTKDGIDINRHSSVYIGIGGSVSISNIDSDGIEVSDDLTNNGVITINSPFPGNTNGFGIYFKGGGTWGFAYKWK